MPHGYCWALVPMRLPFISFSFPWQGAEVVRNMKNGLYVWSCMTLIKGHSTPGYSIKLYQNDWAISLDISMKMWMLTHIWTCFVKRFWNKVCVNCQNYKIPQVSCVNAATLTLLWLMVFLLDIYHSLKNHKAFSKIYATNKAAALLRKYFPACDRWRLVGKWILREGLQNVRTRFKFPLVSRTVTQSFRWSIEQI